MGERDHKGNESGRWKGKEGEMKGEGDLQVFFLFF